MAALEILFTWIRAATLLTLVARHSEDVAAMIFACHSRFHHAAGRKLARLATLVGSHVSTGLRQPDVARPLAGPCLPLMAQNDLSVAFIVGSRWAAELPPFLAQLATLATVTLTAANMRALGQDLAAWQLAERVTHGHELCSTRHLFCRSGVAGAPHWKHFGNTVVHAKLFGHRHPCGNHVEHPEISNDVERGLCTRSSHAATADRLHKTNLGGVVHVIARHAQDHHSVFVALVPVDGLHLHKALGSCLAVQQALLKKAVPVAEGSQGIAHEPRLRLVAAEHSDVLGLLALRHEESHQLHGSLSFLGV
eukprot:m.216692 g.216692  ORF g.216692 m.216692 type:complete len:308 (+) comp48039_c0_seq1:1649-2572(+)